MQRYREHLPILILLTVAFLIGVFTVRQYGESWDELQFYKYADRALAAYSTWPRTGSVPLTGNTYDNYGPAYVMLVSLGARALAFVLPWITSDLRHLLYFSTWLVCIWAFYVFSLRWLVKLPAFGATLLFATQPLFWGHAFISPKDIPFLTFFLLSLEFGFRMADALPGFSLKRTAADIRRPILPWAVAWAVLLVCAYAVTPLVQSWIGTAVAAAAAGQTNAISLIATDIHKVDPSIYSERYFVWFLRLRALFFVASGVVLLWFARKNTPILNSFLSILPAAVLLGMTISIRVLGPLAGMLVVIYAIWKGGQRSIPAILTYGFLALMAMYLTWPYLWPSPVGHFIESVRVMSEYPWKGQVLFNGTSYSSTGLPASYLPVLLAIQLTEPIWILFAIGIVVAAYEALHGSLARQNLLILSAIWFIIPILGFVITRSPLYDNFRQVIFILPPVFMLAGVVLEKLRRPVWQGIAIALLVIPGVLGAVHLHPYEYVYYNSFAGGVQGADRRFELDYWGTSYREAADYLNNVAPANGTIWVEGPAHLLQLYCRPDLKIYSSGEVERAEHYDYVVVLTRYNLDLTTYPDATPVHTIGRDGAAFTVIKKP